MLIITNDGLIYLKLCWNEEYRSIYLNFTKAEIYSENKYVIVADYCNPLCNLF